MLSSLMAVRKAKLFMIVILGKSWRIYAVKIYVCQKAKT